MKITFKNLGPLESTTLNLSKDLIVLTGPNNTGKTFAAYGLYGYFAIIKKIKQQEIPIFPSIRTLIDQKEISCNLEEFIKFSRAVISKEFNLNAKYIFAQAQRNLIDAKVDIEFRPINLRYKYNKDIKLKSRHDQIELNIKVENSVLSVAIKHGISESLLTQQKRISILKGINHTLFLVFMTKRIQIYPVERIGANILKREYTDQLIINEPTYGTSTIPKYPLPIQDYLNFTDSLAESSKQESEFADLADWLEKEILKGKVSTSAYGALQYRPMGSKKTYGVQHTASIVKSLAGIAFYFRHVARKGETIIIDEPELNLHPDNQRIMAKFLAKVVNRGIQVVISTHSSYMIREFNNLIMLNSGKDKAKKLMKEYHYKDDELLDFNKIGAYLFTGNTSEEIPVDNLGFDVSTIDEAINNLNNASQDIYQTLFD